MYENDKLVSIENVVATATLDHTMDLPGILKLFNNAKYHPKRFPGLVFRLKRPKTSTLIFRTGKMVCTGADSEKQARIALRKVVRMLKKEGFIILSKPRIEIVNVVATGDLGASIDLEMAADLLGNVMYEPEQFPGLIYRMEEPSIALLVFASGKVVCTGASDEDQAYEAVEKIHNMVEEYSLFF
jgi:transcription initiation factor TFIID TATA-box-binding protein